MKTYSHMIGDNDKWELKLLIGKFMSQSANFVGMLIRKYVCVCALCEHDWSQRRGQKNFLKEGVEPFLYKFTTVLKFYGYTISFSKTFDRQKILHEV